MGQRLQFILLLFLCNLFVTNGFAQSMLFGHQRIKRIEHTAYRHGRLAHQDSIVYVYSGKRGSEFLAYDYSPTNYYGYKSHYQPGMYEMADLPEPMNDARKLSVKFDTCFYYTISHANGLDSSVLSEFTYTNFKNNEVHRFDYLVPNVHHNKTNRQVVQRDHLGQPQVVYEIEYDTASKIADTLATRIVRYNYLGLASSDTISYRIAKSNLACIYEYDSVERIKTAKQLINKAGRWVDIRQYLLGYNAAGKYNSWTHIQYDDRINAWDTISTIALDYDALGRLQTYAYKNVKAAMPIEDIFILHYNHLGQVDTLTRIYPAQQIFEKVSFYYNEQHNPDSAVLYRSLNWGLSYDLAARTHYFYEAYDTLLTPSDEAVIIYPNPAGNSFTIRWNDKLPQHPVHALIYSSNAQLVRKIHIPQIAIENTVSFSGIASGMYYLRIVTEGGGVLHTTPLSIINPQ